MKISKSLLQAIFAGVTVAAAATSCETVKKDTANIHFSTCPANCDVDHAIQPEDEGEGGGQVVPSSCPACGMG
jgi:hypothetical protein